MDMIRILISGLVLFYSSVVPHFYGFMTDPEGRCFAESNYGEIRVDCGVADLNDPWPTDYMCLHKYRNESWCIGRLPPNESEYNDLMYPQYLKAFKASGKSIPLEVWKNMRKAAKRLLKAEPWGSDEVTTYWKHLAAGEYPLSIGSNPNLAIFGDTMIPDQVVEHVPSSQFLRMNKIK